MNLISIYWIWLDVGMFDSTTSIFWFKATHRVAGHHFGIVDHSDEVDDGEGRVQHVGAEQVLVEGDSLTAQTPVRCNKMLDINMQACLKLLLWWKRKPHTHLLFIYFLRFSPDCRLSWRVWITFLTKPLSLHSTWLLLSENSGSHDLNEWAV